MSVHLVCVILGQIVHRIKMNVFLYIHADIAVHVKCAASVSDTLCIPQVYQCQRTLGCMIFMCIMAFASWRHFAYFEGKKSAS